MRPVFGAGTLLVALAMAGCTQPDGMPDPRQGDDPDNFLFDDESKLAVRGDW